MRLIDADTLKADYGMADECKECRTNVRTCEYDRTYTKMDFCGWLDDAPTVPQWIPVSERLPKEEGHYFVTDEAAGMAETQIDKYIRCDDGEWVWLYSQRVVAWMPLPEPYEGGEQE